MFNAVCRNVTHLILIACCLIPCDMVTPLSIDCGGLGRCAGVCLFACWERRGGATHKCRLYFHPSTKIIVSICNVIIGKHTIVYFCMCVYQKL